MSDASTLNPDLPPPGYNVPERPRRFLNLIARPESITIVLLVAAFAISGIVTPAFRDAEFLLDSTSLYMEVGLLALAMTFVIISGNIDLSPASAMALTGAICGILYQQFHLPAWCIVLLAPLIGTCLGLFNGLLITLLGLPSLTVTLGTLALYRGLAQLLIGEKSIGGWPEWFIGLDKRMVGIVPLPLIIMLIVACALAFLLHKTTFGRTVYAIGTNEQAARFSGLRVNRAKLIVFALSGCMAGIGALMITSRNLYAKWDAANGDELAVITAVVVGGTNIFGGRGSIFGTVIALFLLGIISTGMILSIVSEEKQMAVTGTLLVVAVLLTNIVDALGKRRGR